MERVYVTPAHLKCLINLDVACEQCDSIALITTTIITSIHCFIIDYGIEDGISS